MIHEIFVYRVPCIVYIDKYTIKLYKYEYMLHTR